MKAMMEPMGHAGGPVRPPLANVNDGELDELRGWSTAGGVALAGFGLRVPTPRRKRQTYWALSSSRGGRFHPRLALGVARIGAQRIEARVDARVEQARRPPLDRDVEPAKRFVAIVRGWRRRARSRTRDRRSGPPCTASAAGRDAGAPRADDRRRRRSAPSATRRTAARRRPSSPPARTPRSPARSGRARCRPCTGQSTRPVYCESSCSVPSYIRAASA